MALDIFQDDIRDSDAYANRHLQPSFPAMFDETFPVAWNENALFGQSLANITARQRAASDYAAELERLTGDQSLQPTFATKGLEGLNARIKALAIENPELSINELTEDELDRRAVGKSTEARAAAKAMARREKTFGGQAGGLLGGIVSGATDPINLATFALAAPESLGILATALAWSGIAGGTQLAIEVAGMPYRERIEPGYAQSGEPGENIVGAVVTGGVLGGGLKTLGAAWTRVQTGAWPRSTRDAGNVVASEANVAQTNIYPGIEGEVAHRTALQDSIESLVNGRPINVENVVTPSILAAYEQRLAPVMDARAKAIGAEKVSLAVEREGARLPPTMERLSELQLGEIHNTKLQLEAETLGEREKLQGERQSITATRTALNEAKPELDALRQDLKEIRAEAELARQKANDSARAHGPRAGTLEQEAAGLEKGLARKEKELARAEAKAEKQEGAVASREFRLPVNEQAVEARAASRLETNRNELRRTIGRYASDGYGLKLPPDEAQAIADRILAAPDRKSAERAIRNLTETLVSRRVEVQRTQPAEQLPFGEQPPTRQQMARAEYHTEDVRKGITALAREVGYEMPREEASAISARVVKAPNDNGALAILDELMLRPRTIAETLPGTSAAREPTRGLTEPPAQTISELSKDLTQKRADEIRAAPETDDVVLRNLDRLRAEKGDVEIPMGETITPEGERVPIMRKIEDVIAEAEQRELAAREIASCVGPQSEAAE